MDAIDLTHGSPLKKILLFSLPLVGGSIFQQLYNFIDTLIVGRLLGIDAVAAVGVYYPLNFLILVFIQGSCIGFSIPLSHSVGKQADQESREFLTNAVWLCLIMALIFTPVMMLSAHSLLVALNTPKSILEMALTFTTISFFGIPANILYNYSADALRAFGDSIHPLYFLMASLVLNIILDLVFVLVFHLGIAGIAWATVISEFVGGLLNLMLFRGSRQPITVRRADWRWRGPRIKRMCVIGLPMGLEYSVSAIGAIIMQDAINLLGPTIVAAQSAAEKVRQLFTLPMESVGAAIATYQAQNDGAQARQRMKAGIFSGIWIQVIYSAVAFVVINLFKTTFVTMILGHHAASAVQSANQYIFIISFFFPVHGLLMIFRNTLQGWGHSLYAIVSGIGELLGRSLASILAITSLGFVGICYANPVAWGFSLIYCVVMVVWVFRRGHQAATAPKL
ncbi:MATE family efflux transporter [Levilactobacillus zymae]|uniref:MATE family efflux transporter n=1 Tax=Levilactobacillus zymae TaxID=267363 RepID=UPI003FCEB1A8